MAKRRHRPWWVDRGVYGVLRDGWVTLWRVGWGGIPGGCVRVSANGLLGLPLLMSVEEYADMLLQPGDSRKVVGGEDAQVVDGDFANVYPLVFSYLTQTKWPDGSPRQTSTLSVFADGAVMKCVLKDRHAGLCLWCASKTIGDLFGVLEALLSDPGAEWRHDRQQTGQKATRVQKVRS